MLVTKNNPTTGTTRVPREKARELYRLLQDTLISEPVIRNAIPEDDYAIISVRTKALPCAEFIFTKNGNPKADVAFSLALSVPDLPPFYSVELRRATSDKYEITSDVGNHASYLLDLERVSSQFSPEQVLKAAILFESEIALLLRTYAAMNTVTIYSPLQKGKTVAENQQNARSDMSLMFARAIERICNTLGIEN